MARIERFETEVNSDTRVTTAYDGQGEELYKLTSPVKDEDLYNIDHPDSRLVMGEGVSIGDIE